MPTRSKHTVSPGSSYLMKANRSHLFALIAAIAIPAVAATVPAPDFGRNVIIFSSTMPSATIQAEIDKVYAARNAAMSSVPNAMPSSFLPGDYTLDVPHSGFYTQVLGLGTSPDSVHISGNVHYLTCRCTQQQRHDYLLQRAVENFSVAPTNGSMQWAVSQAAPFRRMHIQGDIVLHQNGGWASGELDVRLAHRRQS